MAGLGLLLPPVLTIGGIYQLWWLKERLPFQPSLSAYYHAGGGCATSYGVYRNVFVGILCVIAACLVIYSGFSALENWLLNCAGLSLLLVALFPTSWTQALVGKECIGSFTPFIASSILGTKLSIHMAAAGSFFLFITIANVLTAFDTIEPLERLQLLDKATTRWRRVFNFARWLMPFTLIGSYLTATNLDPSRTLLWMEWGGIYAFSLYWILKSIEILESKVDLTVFSGQIRFRDEKNNRVTRLKLGPPPFLWTSR